MNAPSISWLPDRKILAGGIGGVLAFGLLSFGKHYGFDLQPLADTFAPPPGTINVLAVLTGGITTGLAYIVPSSARDIEKRLNDQIVAMAGANPNVPVTPPKPAVVKQANAS